MDGAPARAGRPIKPGRPLPRDRGPIWIRLPMAEAERLSPNFALPRYCEAERCRRKRRMATTVHAVITRRGQADFIWVACADCTGLMIDGA